MIFDTTLLAEAEQLAPLIFPPLVFAGIALVVFLAIALVTWSFRDVANRQSPRNRSTPPSGH